jgi:hypothetical protein
MSSHGRLNRLNRSIGTARWQDFDFAISNAACIILKRQNSRKGATTQREDEDYLKQGRCEFGN